MYICTYICMYIVLVSLAQLWSLGSILFQLIKVSTAHQQMNRPNTCKPFYVPVLCVCHACQPFDMTFEEFTAIDLGYGGLLHDATIVAWKEKIFHEAVRPQSFIQHFFHDEMYNVPTRGWMDRHTCVDACVCQLPCVCAKGGRQADHGQGLEVVPKDNATHRCDRSVPQGVQLSPYDSLCVSLTSIAMHSSLDQSEYPSGSACFCRETMEFAKIAFDGFDINGTLRAYFPKGSSLVETGMSPTTDLIVE